MINTSLRHSYVGEFESGVREWRGSNLVFVYPHRRVCGSDNVGIEAHGEPQYDAKSGERAVRDECVQEILPRRV